MASQLRSLALGLVGTSFLAASSASAAILAVDFNADASPTQAGFSAASVGIFDKTPDSFTLGAYTVNLKKLPGGSADSNPDVAKNGARDRMALGASSAAVSDLFRDFVFANQETNKRFELEIEGLDPTTSYDITFYSFDANSTAEQTVTFTQIGNNANSGAVVYNGSSTSPEPTSLADNSLTLTATTDAEGAFAFEVLGTDIATLNGFEVNAVPEPASLALFAAGAAVMLPRRRR